LNQGILLLISYIDEALPASALHSKVFVTAESCLTHLTSILAVFGNSWQLGGNRSRVKLVLNVKMFYGLHHLAADTKRFNKVCRSSAGNENKGLRLVFCEKAQSYTSHGFDMLMCELF
jgi:hypothetical protein